MAGYKVFFRESVEKDFRKIRREDLEKVLARIERLSSEPRPPGCEKLTGQERYRVRQGRYRIVYSVNDSQSTVVVVRVGDRKDVYR